MQLMLEAGLPNQHLFTRNWAYFKLLRRVDFLPWVKDLKYCISYIWLKCLYWNILHCTCDKTVVYVKFCEGWPVNNNTDLKKYIKFTFNKFFFENKEKKQ